MSGKKKKTCEFLDCEKSPCFGIPGEKGRFCKAHAEPGMIDVFNKRCEYLNCMVITPNFGMPGGKGRFCKAHAEPGMVDVKTIFCIVDDCKIQPCFNFPGDKPIYCKFHSKMGMIDVKSGQCTEYNCDTRPSYGLPGHSPTVCARHRKPGMIFRPSAKCKFDKCKKPAFYGKNLTPQRCEEHKLEDDQNLVERECKSCNLPMVLDKDDLCEICNPEAFKKAQLAKQNTVMSFLDVNNLAGTSTDKIIDNGACGKERPDRVYDLGDKVIILEVDENQHKDRPCECEQTRMINVSQFFGGTPVYWIRFNPDEYKATKSSIQQKTINQRLETLLKVLKHIHKNKDKPTAFIQVLYLYFDGWKESDSGKWETLTKLGE
jgi:hypothetical protein